MLLAIAIRALLAERRVKLASSVAKPHGATPVSHETSPETYLGTERAQGFVGTPPATVTRDDGRPRRIAVTSQRLYRLVALGKDGEHTVHLALAPGTSAYAFTFG